MSSPTQSTPASADERFMREALLEARAAVAHGDVPVGAVVVREGVVIGRGHNRREADGDPTAHAEILAIREAAERVGTWYLDGCDLYVTLEPCPMCAGACVLARLHRIIYGATDPKAGACGSVLDVAGETRLNHQPVVLSGLLSEEASALLKAFFRALRERGA